MFSRISSLGDTGHTMTEFGSSYPTYRDILKRTTQLSEQDSSLSSDQAFIEAKKQLIPIVIQALLDQLPTNISHRPGDQFYPDLYFAGQNEKHFARGRLDENLTYHIWRPEGTSHYDLFQQSDLSQLIDDLSRWSISTQTAQQ